MLHKISEQFLFSPYELFNNSNFSRIKTSMPDAIAPWGETCAKCVFYRNGKIENTVDSKRIKKLQLEPTLLCSLKCPGCSREAQIKAGRYPLVMSFKLLENILDGLVLEGYKVDNFELCGQGEPLNHPHIAEYITRINTAFPNSNVSVVTNGNFNAVKKLSGCIIDEVIISTDGAAQESYEKYRVNGNFSKSLSFIEDVRVLFPKANIVWKYILFEHNDSNREVEHAQYLAAQANVDELRFVNTGYGPASTRFSEFDAVEFPIKEHFVTITTHPYIPDTTKTVNVIPSSRHYSNRVIRALNKLFINRFLPFIHHDIDKVNLIKRGNKLAIFVDGWIYKKNKDLKLSIECENNTKEPVLKFSRQYLTVLNQISHSLGFSQKVQFDRIGFREYFFLNQETLSTSVQFTLTVSLGIYKKHYTYDCKID